MTVNINAGSALRRSSVLADFADTVHRAQRSRAVFGRSVRALSERTAVKPAGSPNIPNMKWKKFSE